MHIFRANWTQVIEGLTRHIPSNDLALTLCNQMRASKNPTVSDAVNRWRRLTDGHRQKTHDRLLRALGRAIQLDEQERNRDLNTKAGVQKNTVGHPNQGPKVTLDKAAPAAEMASGTGLLFDTVLHPWSSQNHSKSASLAKQFSQRRKRKLKHKRRRRLPLEPLVSREDPMTTVEEITETLKVTKTIQFRELY